MSAAYEYLVVPVHLVLTHWSSVCKVVEVSGRAGKGYRVDMPTSLGSQLRSGLQEAKALADAQALAEGWLLCGGPVVVVPELDVKGGESLPPALSPDELTLSKQIPSKAREPYTMSPMELSRLVPEQAIGALNVVGGSGGPPHEPIIVQSSTGGIGGGYVAEQPSAAWLRRVPSAEGTWCYQGEIPFPQQILEMPALIVWLFAKDLLIEQPFEYSDQGKRCVRVLLRRPLIGAKEGGDEQATR